MMLARLSWRLTGSLVAGLLVTAPALTARSLAASGVLNPCPGIYYEEPYNSSRLVPSGCRPNAFTQAVNAAGTLTTPSPSGGQLNRVTPTTPNAPIQPPLPETRSNAIATVIPNNGNVDVVLRNTTNAVITYEAVGQTQQRRLAGGEEVVLQNLPVPVTITTVREDDGLIDIQPMATGNFGRIGFSLGASTQLDSDQGAIRIQEDGQVFVN